MSVRDLLRQTGLGPPLAALLLAGSAAAQPAETAQPPLPAPVPAEPGEPLDEDEAEAVGQAAPTTSPVPETGPATLAVPAAAVSDTPVATAPPALTPGLPPGPQPYSSLYPGAAPQPVAPQAYAPAPDPPVAATAPQPYQPAPYATPQPYRPTPPLANAYAAPPPRPQASAPVHVDETDRTPDRPLGPTDLGYDSRLRSSFASAQGLQGPLDGSWTLNVQGVGDAYVLELVDRGSGMVEGAWRDLRRKGALDSSGFIDDIQRMGSQLILRFTPRTGGESAQAQLFAGVDGRWTGEISEGGERRTVVLRRN